MSDSPHPLQSLLKGKPDQWGATIGASIEKIEGEIDSLKKQIKLRRETLKQMKALRGAVAPEAAPAKKPRRKPAARQTARQSDTREQIYDYLSEHGPAKPATIGAALGIHGKTVHATLQHEWFAKQADGYQIAQA